ncbi:MAG TPA: hypothetical protein VIH35_01835 [Kiritimatiellia bacterium]
MAEDPAAKVQTDAYLAVIQADDARDGAAWPDAVRWYRNAIGLYEDLARSRPGWHPQIVQYRLTYCANEIAQILQRTGKSEKDLLAAPVAAPDSGASEAAEANDGLLKENELLRQDVDRLNAELQAARPAAESLEADGKRWQAEAEDLRAQLESLSNKVVQAAPPSRKDVKALKKENERLAYELEQARKRVNALLETLGRQKRESDEKLAEAVRAKRIEKLEAYIKGLRADLKFSEDQIDIFRREVGRLQERIAEMEKESARQKK